MNNLKLFVLCSADNIIVMSYPTILQVPYNIIVMSYPTILQVPYNFIVMSYPTILQVPYNFIVMSYPTILQVLYQYYNAVPTGIYYKSYRLCCRSCHISRMLVPYHYRIRLNKHTVRLKIMYIKFALQKLNPRVRVGG